jgi:hypothetical protein
MTKQTVLGYSNIVTAFNKFTVGTKVTDNINFFKVLRAAVDTYDFEKDRVPGQAFLILPEAIPYVSAGDGLQTQNPDDYIPVLYRGNVELFLRREKAGQTKFCAAVVYTKSAYEADPDWDGSEQEALKGCTHVLVAVIGSSGPKSPLSPYRLVYNLAGGNNEVLKWNADEIRAKAKESLDYWNKYAVVAG